MAGGSELNLARSARGTILRKLDGVADWTANELSRV